MLTLYCYCSCHVLAAVGCSACLCIECFFFNLIYCTTSLLQTISTLSLIFYPIVRDLCSNIPVNIPTLDVPVPVYSAYKNLVISSIGLSHFSRLRSSFSSRTGMSSLGCVINFYRYLVLRLVISALTVGICSSVCITVFGTYRGALTVGLRILFWNHCRISMFDLFAVLQRGTPYVQIGLRIVLYISILVSSGSFDFLPMIQYMLWNCRPSCFLLVNICFCHVSLQKFWKWFLVLAVTLIF